MSLVGIAPSSHRRIPTSPLCSPLKLPSSQVRRKPASVIGAPTIGGGGNSLARSLYHPYPCRYSPALPRKQTGSNSFLTPQLQPRGVGAISIDPYQMSTTWKMPMPTVLAASAHHNGGSAMGNGGVPHRAPQPRRGAYDDEEEEEEDGNTTVVSVGGGALERPSSFAARPRNRAKENDDGGGSLARRLVVVAALVAVVGSPLAMVAIPALSPYTATIDWPLDECGSACDGLLISMSFKLVILLVGAFALFQADASRRRRHMPRVHTARLLVYALAAALLVAYWLFYCARIVARRERNHASIALFATQLADTLIWLHYAALVLFELRPLLGAADYVVEVLRSPDAESHAYTLGRMSLQECAATVLERYYCDFAVYNPYLEKAKGAASSSGSRRQQRFKLYDIDGVLGNGDVKHEANSNRWSSSSGQTSPQELDVKARKRHRRLLEATEDAFAHVRPLYDDRGGGTTAVPMDSDEAAHAIFPGIARALQRFLRATRQQPFHSATSILEHLSDAIAFRLSPLAFLRRFSTPRPILFAHDDSSSLHQWSLLCRQMPSSDIEEGSKFRLRWQAHAPLGGSYDVCLMVSVRRLPRLRLEEERPTRRDSRFTLRLPRAVGGAANDDDDGSETSV